jgi:DNA-binding NarL/FixJ family response regulator
MSTKPIRVLAVDDHSLLRDGIAKLLAAQPDMELVAEASNAVRRSSSFEFISRM